MSGPIRLSKPSSLALRWLRINSVLAVMAMSVVLGGLSPSVARAQKSINFATTGSVRSTLVFTNQISPDVYSFRATVGDQIEVRTSDNTFDTTIRVIGPDASISLFDDDSGGNLASLLVFTAQDTGTYIVVVSSFSGNPGGGDYTLNFARTSPPGAGDSLDVDPIPGESLSRGENPVAEKLLK